MEKYIKVGVGVMMLKDDCILLCHRRADRADTGGIMEPDTWALPGGKQEYGETILQCAAREIYEECGMNVKSAHIFSAADDIAADRHFVTLWVIADDFDGTQIAKEPEKEDEWRWFSLDNLPQNLYSPSAKFITAFLTQRKKR